ncbi:MAG TPA: hypothetical protein VN414_08845, partial [Methanosarcina sp.]|nr:hypothetical protein [Methanosarcina sp.]
MRKYKENVEPEIFESVKNRILVLKYSALECYFLNPDILYKLGIVGNNNEFNTILNDHVKDERNIIEKYIKERNKKNKARINQLIDEIYNT